MKNKREFLKAYLCGMIGALITVSVHACSYYPDSPPEEAVEAVIRDVTGIDIDLTSEDGP